jgi:hypothetical protein
MVKKKPPRPETGGFVSFIRQHHFAFRLSPEPDPSGRDPPNRRRWACQAFSFAIKQLVNKPNSSALRVSALRIPLIPEPCKADNIDSVE